jgi:hypothetical protein
MTLIIRESQMQSMRAANENSFVEAVYLELKTKFASSLGDATLREARPDIESAIEKSRGYGISAEADTMAFVALSFVISPTFDEHAPIRRRLVDPSIPGDQRMTRIFDEVPEEEWRKNSSKTRAAGAD